MGVIVWAVVNNNSLSLSLALTGMKELVNTGGFFLQAYRLLQRSLILNASSLSGLEPFY